jgi:uncharacterized repeat protein (TIGR03803 family)
MEAKMTTHNSFRRQSQPASLLLVAIVLLLAPAPWALAQAEKVLYRFAGGADSGEPYGGLVADKLGNLYGTTSGNSMDCGTVFELSPPATGTGAWTETVLYSFDCAGNGTGSPWAGLIIDSSGNLYGTTFAGPTGTAFELSPPLMAGGAWTETVLHNFVAGTSDGGGPEASLTRDSAGNLYGTTQIGGHTGSDCPSQGCGVVFELSPPSTSGAPWTETILHFFSGLDGRVPAAGVTLGKGGALFGTTFYGGSTSTQGEYGYGVVFRLLPPLVKGGAWKENVLYNFTNSGDGGYPAANLVFDTKGNLYGTAYGAQVSLSVGCFLNPRDGGAVFELSPPLVAGGAWTETTLYAFSDGADGGNPYAGVVLDKSGNLYGTTASNANGCGSVFQLTQPATTGGNWTESVLYMFTGGRDGGEPASNLIFGPGNGLYGTTANGGNTCQLIEGETGCGTVFKLVK